MTNDKDIKRFLSKVKVLDTFGCWEWTGTRFGVRKGEEAKPGYGHGQFVHQGKKVLAHRFAYEHLGNNEPPGDMCVLHTCDNPKCVNPAHLFLGTKADNCRDRDSKGRNATGDRNGSRLHPEKLARGDSHPSKTQPEKLRRGASHGMAKLTEDDVRFMREVWALPKPRPLDQGDLAEMHGIDNTTVSLIVRGKLWKHVV